MADIKVVVRKNATVSDKPKVYVSYHPNEFHKLEKVTSDILLAKDCSVFYYPADDNPVDREQVRFELKNMHLFVFVVTSALLSERPESFLRDISIARENKIPVLPLMMEQDLQVQFNEFYGDIQWLSAVDDDPTAIPYQEKLTSYLNQFFPDTVKVESIRQAFSGTIFLSYRKKDRALANTLMHMIHKQKDLLGISIWYDEFLAPGESFNDSIKEALQESDIMILLVTPNTVAENNYIIKVEYPEACSMRKEIVPVEMEHTGRTELVRAFQGISPAIVAKNDAAFGNFLRELSCRFGLTVQNDSPQRDYLIGLAYLFGLRVEKNSDIGVMMIRSAAEAGLDEAINKFAFMCSIGDGVQKDTEEAIRWYERLIELRTNAFEENVCEQAAKNVLVAYLALAELYQNTHDFSLANHIYLNRMGPFGVDSRISGSILVRKILIFAYGMCGKNLMEMGEYFHARCIFNKSVSLLEDSLKQDPTLESVLELMENHQNIGDSHRALDQNTMYRSSYLEALRIESNYRDLISKSSQTDDFRVQRRLFSFHNRCAHMHIETGYDRKAIECSNTAVSIIKKLNEQHGTLDTKLLLISAYINAADIYASAKYESDSDYAAFLYKCALELGKEAVSADDSPSTKRLLAVCYRESDKFDDAIKLFSEIEEQTHTFSAMCDVYRTYYKWACLLFERDMLPEALEQVENSIKRNEEILEKADNKKIFLYDLADSFSLMGKIQGAQKRYSAALRAYKKANGLLAEAADDTQLVSAYVKYINSFDVLIKTAKMGGRFAEHQRMIEEKARVLDKVNAELVKAGRPTLDGNDSYSLKD